MSGYTETEVINRDWRKLSKKYGHRWTVNYFKKVDKLFNPNFTMIVRYQYSGVWVKNNDQTYSFHAITDINLKKARVPFILNDQPFH